MANKPPDASSDNLALTLLTLAGGGLVAAYADATLGPQYDITIMGDDAVPGSGVTLTPGLMAGAVGIAAGIMLKSPTLSLVATGALASALTDLGKQKLLPMVTANPALTGPAAVKGLPPYYAQAGACGPQGMTGYELQESMRHYAS